MLRRIALAALLLTLIGLVSCSGSGLTVDITIPVSVGTLSSPTASTVEGQVLGYIFTPAADSTGAGTVPRVLQTPIPPAGYEVPDASVLVSLQGSTTSIRPDTNGFFYFGGQAPGSAPLQVRVEFPGGGFSDLVTEVPVVSVEREGWAVQQVDLQLDDEYRNNARDIRSIAGVLMNFDISANENALARLYASARGDLTGPELSDDPEAYLLYETTLPTGQTSSIRDVKPLNEGPLVSLADPDTGNQMLFLYLTAEEPQSPANGAAVTVAGLELRFKARVAAPL